MRTRETAEAMVPIPDEGGNGGFIEVQALPLFDANGEVRWVAFTARNLAGDRKPYGGGRTREHFFRSLLDQSFDGVSLINERGEMVFLSPSVKRILGYSEAELLGQPGPEFSPPEEKEFVWGKFAELLSDPGGILTLEWRMLHKDGHEVILEGIARNLLDDPSVGGIVLNYRDVTQWRRGEEVVLDRDRKLIAVFRNAHLAIGLVSDRTILDINEAACRLSGYSREELLGSKTAILYQSPAEAESVGRELYRQIAEKGVGAVNAPLRRKDGSLRSAIISGSKVDPKRPEAGYLITFLDLTDQRRAEKALSDREAELHSIFRAAPIGIAATLKRVFVEANEKFCEMTGYSREELIGNHARMLYPTPEESDRIGAMYEEIQASGLGSVETVWRRKDGSLISILLNSTAITPEKPDAEITVTATDITKRKRAEEALRDSEALYRTVVENMQDVLYRTDIEGGIILTSPSAPKLLGYDKIEEFYGKRVSDLYADPSQRQKFLKVLAEKGSVRDYEVTLKRKDGMPVHVSTSSHFIYGADGAVSGVEGLFHDITERKRMDEALKESEARYRTFIDATSDLVFLKDESLRYLFSNRANNAFLGVSQDAVEGRTNFDLLPAEMADRFSLTDRQTLETGGVVTSEESAGGRFYQVTKFPVSLQGGKTGVGGYVHDITERKQAQESLRASEALYRTVVENMQDVLYRTDREGRIILTTPSALKLLGYDCIEDMYGVRVADLYADPSQRAKFLEVLAEKGSVRDYEVVLKRKDGTPVFISTSSHFYYGENGQVLGVEGVYHDITERKRAEEVIRRSEEKYRLLVETASSIILRVNRHGRITFCNDFAQRFFGYAEAELLGREAADTILPEKDASGQDFREFMGDLFIHPEHHLTHENENRRRNGERVWVAWANKPIRDEAGDVVEFLCVGNDVTAHKRLEEDYRSLFEGVPIGIYRTTPDGRILRANPAMVRMLGYASAEDLATRNLERECFDPDHPRASFKKELEASGEVKAMEGLLVTKDGRKVFIRENAKLARTPQGETYYDGTVEDVTETRRRQEMLQVMAKAIEFSRLGITLTDREGRITFTNAASASMLGYEVEDLLGKNMRVFAPTRLWKPKDIEELESYDRESVNIRKDGTEFPVWLSSDVVKDEKGAAVGIVTICEDLTERRHQEALLENARRMEFMGRLVAGVAHEVRNPLNAIQVTTSVLKKEMEDDPDRKQLLDLIEGEVDRLAQLTRDLLELGKPPDPARFRVHSLRELCDVAVENWGYPNPEQARRVLRRVDAVAGDDWVMADALKIQQAVINLLDNALQHSPPEGEIVMGLREEENLLRISVSDHGAGVPTALVGRVFDPFFTTRQGGTGLGLPIVKATAENHGGTARLWNEDPPLGCTVEIVLPKYRQLGDEP